MKKYRASVHRYRWETCTFDVEAANRDEAEALVLERVERDHVVNWEPEDETEGLFVNELKRIKDEVTP